MERDDDGTVVLSNTFDIIPASQGLSSSHDGEKYAGGALSPLNHKGADTRKTRNVYQSVRSEATDSLEKIEGSKTIEVSIPIKKTNLSLMLEEARQELNGSHSPKGILISPKPSIMSPSNLSSRNQSMAVENSDQNRRSKMAQKIAQFAQSVQNVQG